MTSELLTNLIQRLNEPAHRYAELDRYYSGKQPLAFVSPEAKVALGNRFGRIASNIPRLAVTALAERLRVTGFSDAGLWADWMRCDLDQLSGAAHREALLFGDSYVIVWADALGRPQVSVESAKQVAVLTDPGSRQVLAAVKRWEDIPNRKTFAVLYEPDRITRLQADQASAAAAVGFKPVEVIPNPLGVVPVVNLRNSDILYADFEHPGSWEYDRGRSEIDDIVPLVDGLNKTLADMLIASEYAARPRRWATGIELDERPVLDDTGNPVLDAEGQPATEAVNPIPEGNRAMIAEAAEAKFGQLPGADLQGYETAVNVLLAQIMAVSALPAHYVGITHDNPASADAIRSAEASLTARAEARQQMFGRAWEQAAKLMAAVRDGRDPSQIGDIRVKWSDAATRSVAQEADAVVKLYQAGLLPASVALERLGYTADEVDQIRAARRAEALDGAGVDVLSGLVGS